MADVFWPGDHRAQLAFQPIALVEAMVEVERAWSKCQDAPFNGDPVTRSDLEVLAVDAEAGGNPLIPLVDLMRARLRERGQDDAAGALHRGLTSQDVLDTALMQCARSATHELLAQVDSVARSLGDLVVRHRADPMIGRTLTQHARPITFGLKVAHWLQGVINARDGLRGLRFPAQLAGPVGVGLPQAAAVADVLGLDDAAPWHTVRTPITRYGDALVEVTDALAHVANDVLVLARTEVAELGEPLTDGRGGSSSMPHKQNPVLSVLIRRAALTTPGLAAQLHLAAADTRDERPDGSWHSEWPVLADLSRRTIAAASQAAELVAGLRVHTEVMAARVDEPADQVLVDQTIDRVLARVEEQP